MDRLVEKVRDIGYLADRYDPRYQGPERVSSRTKC